MSFGLLVIAINIGYLIFSIIAGIALAKLLKKGAWFQQRSTALLAIVIFLLILFAPFYDLLIQKGIKTYYEVFDKTYATIYAYPEKDSEGRVESLAMEEDYMTEDSGYLSTKKDFFHFKEAYRVYDFIELYMKDSFIVKDGEVIENNKKDMGYTRVYLNKSKIRYDKIDSIENFKARYIVLTKINKYYFYTEKIVSFWDKKTNKLLAKGVEIDFPVKDEESKFRYYLLHWHGANGLGVNILRFYNQHVIFKKLFNFSRNFSRI